MTNKRRVKRKEDMVMIVVRIPQSLRRKLKMIAAYENLSMNDKARDYIEKGIKREEKMIDNIEAN
jgi:plasmid stability protein